MATALERRYARLERQRLALLARLAPYDDAQHAFRPEPSGWSLADVLQHLILVEEGLVRYARAKAAKRPAWVSPRALLRERVMLAVLARDTRLKVPTPIVAPGEHLPLAVLVPRWEAARADLLSYLTDLPGPRWVRAAVRHPWVGWMSSMGGLRFCEAHCAHHARQVERIVAHGDFAAAGVTKAGPAHP